MFLKAKKYQDSTRLSIHIICRIHGYMSIPTALFCLGLVLLGHDNGGLDFDCPCIHTFKGDLLSHAHKSMHNKGVIRAPTTVSLPKLSFETRRAGDKLIKEMKDNCFELTAASTIQSLEKKS